MTLKQFITVNVIQKGLALIILFLRTQNEKCLCMEPEPPFLPGAGADPIWSEPESAPGPRTSGAGAAKKSGGSATLHLVFLLRIGRNYAVITYKFIT